MKSVPIKYTVYIMKYILMTFIVFTSTFAKMSTEDIDKEIKNLFKIVNSTQNLRIKEEFYSIDLERLLKMTAQIESRYGQDNYNHPVALSPFQYEPTTAIYYMKIVPELREFIESKLGRKLKIHNDKDSVYITYIIYMSKLNFHKKWLDKYYRIYYTNDIEWLIYKILWNSTKGKSTNKKWYSRNIELRVREIMKEGVDRYGYRGCNSKI